MTLQQQIESNRRAIESQRKQLEESRRKSAIRSQSELRGVAERSGRVDTRSALTKRAERKGEKDVLTKNIGEVNVYEDTFEKEVASKSPQYAKEKYIEPEYEKAKKILNEKIAEQKASIERKKAEITRLGEGGYSSSEIDIVGNIEDSISIDNARLNSYQSSLGGTKADVINNVNTGYAEQLANYEADSKASRIDAKRQATITTQELPAITQLGTTSQVKVSNVKPFNSYDVKTGTYTDISGNQMSMSKSSALLKGATIYDSSQKVTSNQLGGVVLKKSEYDTVGKSFERENIAFSVPELNIDRKGTQLGQLVNLPSGFKKREDLTRYERNVIAPITLASDTIVRKVRDFEYDSKIKGRITGSDFKGDNYWLQTTQDKRDLKYKAGEVSKAQKIVTPEESERLNKESERLNKLYGEITSLEGGLNLESEKDVAFYNKKVEDYQSQANMFSSDVDKYNKNLEIIEKGTITTGLFGLGQDTKLTDIKGLSSDKGFTLFNTQRDVALGIGESVSDAGKIFGSSIGSATDIGFSRVTQLSDFVNKRPVRTSEQVTADVKTFTGTQIPKVVNWLNPETKRDYSKLDKFRPDTKAIIQTADFVGKYSAKGIGFAARTLGGKSTGELVGGAVSVAPYAIPYIGEIALASEVDTGIIKPFEREGVKGIIKSPELATGLLAGGFLTLTTKGKVKSFLNTPTYVTEGNTLRLMTEKNRIISKITGKERPFTIVKYEEVIPKTKTTDSAFAIGEKFGREVEVAGKKYNIFENVVGTKTDVVKGFRAKEVVLNEGKTSYTYFLQSPYSKFGKGQRNEIITFLEKKGIPKESSQSILRRTQPNIVQSEFRGSVITKEGSESSMPIGIVRRKKIKEVVDDVPSRIGRDTFEPIIAGRKNIKKVDGKEIDIGFSSSIEVKDLNQVGDLLSDISSGKKKIRTSKDLIFSDKVGTADVKTLEYKKTQAIGIEKENLKLNIVKQPRLADTTILKRKSDKISISPTQDILESDVYRLRTLSKEKKNVEFSQGLVFVTKGSKVEEKAIEFLKKPSSEGRTIQETKLVTEQEVKSLAPIVKKLEVKTKEPSIKSVTQELETELPSMVGGKGLKNLPYSGGTILMEYETTTFGQLKPNMDLVNRKLEMKEVTKSDIKLDTITLTKTKSDVKQLNKFRMDTKVLNKQDVVSKLDTLSKQDIKQGSLSKSLLKSKLLNKQLSKSDLTSVSKQVNRLKIKEPKIEIKKRIKIPIDLDNKRKRTSDSGTFKAFGRRLGKDIKLGTGTKEQAEKKLESFLGKTLGASGYIESGGRKLKTEELSLLEKGFKTSKKDSFRIVESKERRLKKGTGEVPEIQMFKKKSKGLLL